MSSDHLLSELRQIVKGEVCSENNPEYERQVKGLWNGRLYNKKPLMIVAVSNNDDIAKTLAFCKKNKLPLCICNGGTSMFAQDDGAVVIVLTKLNKVTVDSKNKVAKVECGALLSDVDRTTVAHNLVTPLAQASYIGVTGCGLLLGMAILGRSYGFTMDNIQSFEMITVSGETITTSKTEKPELFWAMKGYGFNFGIVTKFWIKLHSIPNQVMAGILYYTWRNAAGVLKLMRDFLKEKNDNRLVLYGIIYTAKERAEPSIIIRYFYNGDLEKGKIMAVEFLKKSPPVDNSGVRPMAYDDFQKSVDHLHPFGNYYFGDAGYQFEDLSDDVIESLITSFNQLPCIELMSGGATYIVPMGGAYTEVPEDDSPFIFRKAKFAVHVVASTTDANYQPQTEKWLEETGTALSRFSIKPDPSKSNTVMERLRQVKRHYDPDNIFKYNINIDPN